MNLQVGIITIIDHYNFGNRLQNFALQEALNTLGYHPITIPNTPRLGADMPPLSRYLTALRIAGVRGAYRKARTFASPPKSQDVPEWATARILGNSTFTQVFINQANAAYEEIPDRRMFATNYHKFIVGSDQVWNPHLRYSNPIDFLAFAVDHQRIAYAASFGLDELNARDASRYRRYLMGIPQISVREERAAEIVHALTGRCVPIVLDPTLLLPPERWHDIARAPRNEGADRYLVKFYLGEEHPERARAVARFAQAHQLTILDLNDPTSTHFCTSPEDFVGAIRFASLVVTDSYHAAAFSTTFHTPFVIQGRGAMNSRFSTLLRTTGLRNRQCQEEGDLETASDIDWKDVELRLSSARSQSWRYLEQSLALGLGRRA